MSPELEPIKIQVDLDEARAEIEELIELSGEIEGISLWWPAFLGGFLGAAFAVALIGGLLVLLS